jgi:hypothetical protein
MAARAAASHARAAAPRRRRDDASDRARDAARAVEPALSRRHRAATTRVVRASASAADVVVTVAEANDEREDERDARVFVNLKNGIEAIDDLRALRVPYAFARIQSTMCEVGDLEKVLLELDASFMLDAALGRSVVVVDYGSRDRKRGAPRALWYGLEFVRYALNRAWFGYKGGEEEDGGGGGESGGGGTAGAHYVPVCRGKNVTNDFRRKYSALSKSCKKRLKYYRKFLKPPPEEDALPEFPGGGDSPSAKRRVRLVGAYKFTDKDDDDAFYVEALHRAELGTTAVAGAAHPAARASMTEREALDALEGRGFRVLYSGDTEEEWLEQRRGRGGA